MDVSCIGSSVIVHAPAKLNLFLEVIAKRPDGFHEIETLMAAISLYDTLVVSPETEEKITLRWRWADGIEARTVAARRTGRDAVGGALPEETQNIVWRAAERLGARAGVRRGAHIDLVKRIPTEAGLGGASSDAAAALVGLNLVWQIGWNRSRLAEMAAELGSDIPFFLGAAAPGAALAVCRGRGECVEPVTGIPRLDFVVVRPPGGLATASVYQQCRPAAAPRSSRLLLTALHDGGGLTAGKRLFNRLQDAAETLSPWIARTRRAFAQLDCLGHQMSGSGTSYFGLCRNAKHARRLLGLVRSAGLGQVYHAATITGTFGPSMPRENGHGNH